MRSRNGKWECLCPHCKSAEIIKSKRRQAVIGECQSCSSWWSWASRVRIEADVYRRWQERRHRIHLSPRYRFIRAGFAIARIHARHRERFDTVRAWTGKIFKPTSSQ